MRNFVFTCGDINGIGPETVFKTLNHVVQKKREFGYYFICPANVFKSITSIIKPQFEFSITSAFRETEPGKVTVINTGNETLNRGKPTEDSGRTAFTAIQLSFALLKYNYADAVITAPVSKTALQLAGVEYMGHTEMFADWCGIKNYAMTFLSAKMNAALATIHKPLMNISELITADRLNILSQIILTTLREDLNIKEPSVAVLGLNPHAGENGLIGTEEEKIIKPFIQQGKIKNFFSGPFSPDAFFAGRQYRNYDMVLGMYHDQLLIPFKMLNFHTGVNYTAGLPVVRTSPDHGTAYDIAWQNKANETSTVEAFKYAERITGNRRKNAGRLKKNI